MFFRLVKNIYCCRIVKNIVVKLVFLDSYNMLTFRLTCLLK